MYLHIHDLKVGTLSLFLSEVDISLSFSVENYENISRQPCIGLMGKLDLLISIKSEQRTWYFYFLRNGPTKMADIRKGNILDPSLCSIVYKTCLKSKGISFQPWSIYSSEPSWWCLLHSHPSCLVLWKVIKLNDPKIVIAVYLEKKKYSSSSKLMLLKKFKTSS